MCSYDGTQKNLSVNLSGADSIQIGVSAGNIVVTFGPGIPADCGIVPPTVTNTNEVVVVASGTNDNLVIFSDPGALAPGASDESGDNEIEVSVNMGGEINGDHLRLVAGDSGSNIRRGADGINTNAAPAEDVPDADIIYVGVEIFDVLGGAGPDALGVQGGAGTGAAITDGVSLSGGGGNDHLTGGTAPDGLDGGPGNDELNGGDGGDGLVGGPGNDVIAGEGGVDEANYSNGPGGVTVDLSRTGPQDTRAAGTDTLSSIEDVDGTSEADTLIGNALPNNVRAFGGDDTVDVQDGAADTADCGDGTDSVFADPPAGTDTLVSCESVSFQPRPQPQPQPQPGPGDFEHPTFTGTPRAVPARFAVNRRGKAETPVATAVKKGTRIRYSLSEAATVTFAVQRRTVGRRVRGRCRKRTRANRSRKHCTRFVPVAAFAQPAAAGANTTRFSGRIGRRALKPGRYRMLLVARDAAGNASTPAKLAFRVIRAKRR